MQLSYLCGLEDAIDQGNVDLNKLYFEDECPIFVGGLPDKARSRRGTAVFGRANYTPTRYSLLAVISNDKWIKVELVKGNTNDEVFRGFCLNDTPRPDFAPNLGGPPVSTLIPEGSFVVWDRLGRSGRCLNPTKIHYNPEVLEDIRTHKSKVQLLPPKGHDLNPIELFNNIIQQKVKRWLPANPEKDEYDNIVPGPRTFEECQIAVSDALETLKGKSTLFAKMYKKASNWLRA